MRIPEVVACKLLNGTLAMVERATRPAAYTM
jgi:hypothetical protein